MELPVEWGSDDGTTDGTVYDRWGKLFLDVGDKAGRTFRIIDQNKELIEKVSIEEGSGLFTKAEVDFLSRLDSSTSPRSASRSQSEHGPRIPSTSRLESSTVSIARRALRDGLCFCALGGLDGISRRCMLCWTR